jgi:thioredoxin-dependent peroxiredoxin
VKNLTHFVAVLALGASLASVACDKGTTGAAPAGSGSAAAAAVSDKDLVAGDMAPDVELPLQDGSKVKLADKKGGIVLVYFYPKDDTPGCTAEAQGLRDNFDELKGLGVTVYGVSTQDADSHQAFIDKYDLPFPLVIDDGTVSKAFQVPSKLGFLARQSFLIGKDGKILKVWRDVDARAHAAEVLAAAKAG